MDILLTNDDGIQSGALRALAVALAPLARVVVVAPLYEQSGVGQAFTLFKPLRFGVAADYPCGAHWVQGTPADCTKFAVCELYKDRCFDVVISGINNGENAGVSACYSGTVAAAREAALWSIPALAISAQKQTPAAIATALEWAAFAVREQLFRDMPSGVFWNVNFPSCQDAPCAGLRVGRMSTVMFTDYYKVSTSADGGSEFQLDGEKQHHKSPEGSDDWWLHRGYATLTPLRIDQTCDLELARLQALWSAGELHPRSPHV